MVHLPLCFLFPLRPQRYACLIFCIAGFISIFGTWECLWWLQINYFCIPGVIPIPACLRQLPSNDFILYHSPQPHKLAKLTETVNLAFLSIPAMGNHFQRHWLFAAEKQERILFFVVSSPQWQRLTYYETSSFRQRGEREQGMCKLQECPHVHTHWNMP